MVTVNTSPPCQAVIGGMLLEHGSSLIDRPPQSTALPTQSDLPGDCLGHDPLPAGIDWNRPHGGFLVRAHLPVPADADLLTISAAKYGVLWTPMNQFYPDGSSDRQLRLSCSYSTRSSRPPLVTTCRCWGGVCPALVGECRRKRC